MLRLVTRNLDLVTLLCLVSVILVPPVVHGYWYPGIGDDPAVHMAVIDSFAMGSLPSTDYWGQLLVGAPMAALSNATGISVGALYLWWSYSMLALAGVVIYFVVRSIFSRWAGTIAAILVVFGVESTTYLFGYGQIFDLVNMFIILPLLLWSIVIAVSGLRAALFMSAALLGLFVVFHPTGFYIPGHGGISTPVSHSVASSATSVPRANAVPSGGMSIPSFVFGTLGILPVGLAVFVLSLKPKFNREQGVFLAMALGVCIFLIVGWLSGLSPRPERQAMDLAGWVVITVSGITGVVLHGKERESEEATVGRDVPGTLGAGGRDGGVVPQGVPRSY